MKAKASFKRWKAQVFDAREQDFREVAHTGLLGSQEDRGKNPKAQALYESYLSGTLLVIKSAYEGLHNWHGHMRDSDPMTRVYVLEKCSVTGSYYAVCIANIGRIDIDIEDFAKEELKENCNGYVHTHCYIEMPGVQKDLYVYSIVSYEGKKTHSYHYDASQVTWRRAQILLDKKRKVALETARSARKIKRDEHRDLLDSVADEVIEDRSDFEELGFCNQGIEDVERALGGADALYGTPVHEITRMPGYPAIAKKYKREVLTVIDSLLKRAQDRRAA